MLDCDSEYDDIVECECEYECGYECVDNNYSDEIPYRLHHLLDLVSIPGAGFGYQFWVCSGSDNASGSGSSNGDKVEAGLLLADSLIPRCCIETYSLRRHLSSLLLLHMNTDDASARKNHGRRALTLEEEARYSLTSTPFATHRETLRPHRSFVTLLHFKHDTPLSGGANPHRWTCPTPHRSKGSCRGIVANNGRLGNGGGMSSM